MNTKYLVSALALSAAVAAQAIDMEGDRGIKVGERMTLRPYVALSYTYDSNIDSAKHSKDGSQWIINPGVDLVYLAENWLVEGSVWYKYHAYNRYVSQLNESSYGESLKFDWSNSAPDEKGWRALFTERFEQIAQDDDMTGRNGRGIGRDRKEFHADGILERRMSERLHAAALANYYFLEYDNNVNKYAPLYGWKRAIVGAEAGYASSPWTDFIIHANYQWYWQDNDFDRSEEWRGDSDRRGRKIYSDSCGWSLMGGLASHATEKISYRLLGGWSRFEYADGAKDINGFTYQASANWKIDETMSIMLLGSSYYQPSEREYGSAIKVYTLSCGLAKSFIRNKLTGTLDLAYRKEGHEYVEYAEDDYDEDIWTARVGLNYQVNRILDVYGRIEYQTEETRGGGVYGHAYDYDRWRGTVGVRLTY